MRNPRNVPGRFWVDCDNCFEHGICQTEAPNNFFLDESPSDPTVMGAYVVKQPENAEELQQCLTAMAFCPMAVIHDNGAVELMDAGDPNRKSDDHTWPPPPTIEPPERGHVDERYRWPIAQIAAGFCVGVLSPVAIMSVIGDVVNGLQLTGASANAVIVLAIVAVFVIQVAAFAYQRKRRPAFAKTYLVTSSIAAIAWCLRL